VPNAGRIVPYYIQNMWMKDKDGLVASLLGPCKFTTQIKNVTVSIKEETAYPFENDIRFRISCKQPSTFSIKIRKPDWAVSIKSSIQYKEENGFLIFQQTWNKQTNLTISFTSKIVKKETANKEVYLESGPFVMCTVFDAKKTITKAFNIVGLNESIYKPVNNTTYHYTNNLVSPVSNSKNTFRTMMINSSTGKKEAITLVPMAKTILRQVTFPIKK
jgi:DUF1680 family protein